MLYQDQVFLNLIVGVVPVRALLLTVGCEPLGGLTLNLEPLILVQREVLRVKYFKRQSKSVSLRRTRSPQGGAGVGGRPVVEYLSGLCIFGPHLKPVMICWWGSSPVLRAQILSLSGVRSSYSTLQRIESVLKDVRLMEEFP